MGQKSENDVCFDGGAWVWDTNKRKGHQDQERHKEGERRETVTLIEVDFQNKSKSLRNLLKVGFDNKWGIPCADRLASFC